MINIPTHEHDEKGAAIAAALLAELNALTQAQEADPLLQASESAAKAGLLTASQQEASQSQEQRGLITATPRL